MMQLSWITRVADRFSEAAVTLRSLEAAKFANLIATALPDPDPTFRDRVVCHILYTGDDSEFRKALTANDQTDLLRLARAADRSFGRLLEGASAWKPALTLHLTMQHRLNSESDGWVIPRRSVWAETTAPADPGGGLRAQDVPLFDHLLYIPKRISAGNKGNAEIASDRTVQFTPRFFSWRDSAAISEWKIGIAPLAEDEGDFAFKFSTKSTGSRVYSAEPQNLSKRLHRVLSRLARDGAHIVVLPELTLKESELSEVRQAIRSANALAGAQIRLLIAGIASARTNKVLLLDRDGSLIGEQKKLHRWDLRDDQRKRYGLDTATPRHELLLEDIECGDEISVYDFPDLGRMAIAVCADFSHDHPVCWLRDNLLLDWTFVPLLDGPLVIGNWVCRRGGAASRFPGGRVVVSNSMSLTRHQNRVQTPSGEFWTDECGVAHCFDALPHSELRHFIHKEKLVGRPDRCAVIPWRPDDWDTLP